MLNPRTIETALGNEGKTCFDRSGARVQPFILPPILIKAEADLLIIMMRFLS